MPREGDSVPGRSRNPYESSWPNPKYTQVQGALEMRGVISPLALGKIRLCACAALLAALGLAAAANPAPPVEGAPTHLNSATVAISARAESADAVAAGPESDWAAATSAPAHLSAGHEPSAALSHPQPASARPGTSGTRASDLELSYGPHLRYSAQSVCFSGVYIVSITPEEDKTRAGNILRATLSVENEDSTGRNVFLRVVLRDPSGVEVERLESPAQVPPARGWWWSREPGKLASDFTFFISADGAAGTYSLDGIILSTDNTNECETKTRAAIFSVLDFDTPWAVRDSPDEDPVTIRRQQGRTFTATASDNNSDLTEYEWKVNGEVQETARIESAGSAAASFHHVFPEAGDHRVEVRFSDRSGLSDSIFWSVAVLELPRFCDEEEDFLVCGYASDWARTGSRTKDTRLIVSLLPPSATEELPSLQITIHDPDALLPEGAVRLAVPKAAWIDYRGVRKEITGSTFGNWSELSPEDERNNQALLSALDAIVNISVGAIPLASPSLTATEFFLSLGGAAPSGRPGLRRKPPELLLPGRDSLGGTGRAARWRAIQAERGEADPTRRSG